MDRIWDGEIQVVREEDCEGRLMDLHFKYILDSSATTKV